MCVGLVKRVNTLAPDFRVDSCFSAVQHPLSRDVAFCLLLEVPVTNWAAQ